MVGNIKHPGACSASVGQVRGVPFTHQIQKVYRRQGCRERGVLVQGPAEVPPAGV